MLKVRVLGVLVATSLTLTLAACGGDDESESGSDAPAGSDGGGARAAEVEFAGSIEDGLPVGYGDVEGGDLTIGFANPNDSRESLNINARAMKLETEKLGGEFVNLDAQANPDKQISDVQQLIAQRVDAIIIFPFDPDALGPVLKQAERADIPVVGIESNLDSATDPGKGFDTQVWQRRDYMSFLQAQEAARLRPAGAKFGQIGFAIPAPTLEKSVERAGFWAEKVGLTIVGRVDSPTDDIAGGEEAMTELLSKYPDVEGVIAYTEETATGAQAAARAQGKDDLVLIGNNGDSGGFASVEAGKIDATVQIQAADLGAMAVHGAYLLAEGKKVPPTVMTGEPKLITKDTLDEVPTKEEVLEERYGKTG